MPRGSDAAGIAFRTLGGTGPDCLLLHGFGSDRLSWLGTAPHLQEVVKVHSLDLPGHGESSLDVGDGSPATLARCVEMELDRRDLRRLHIIGHSLGGGIAIHLAAHRPDLVASVQLIAPAALGTGIDAEFLASYPGLVDTEAAMSLLQRLVVRPHIVGRQVAQRVLDQLLRQGARAALERIGANLMTCKAEFDRLAAIVAATSLPRLVIWGAQDGINPRSPDRLARFGGELHVVADAGHLPHIESARVVNAILLAFLRRQIGG